MSVRAPSGQGREKERRDAARRPARCACGRARGKASSSQPVAHAAHASRCAKAAWAGRSCGAAGRRARRSCWTSAPRARPRPARGSLRARRSRPGERRRSSRIVNSREVSWRGSARPPRRAAARVEPQVAGDELPGGPRSLRRSRARGARGEDLEVEGLAEIVVGALGEALDLVLGLVHGRQHEDRVAEAAGAGAAADVEAVAVGQPAVEHQQVVLVEVEQLLGLVDARGLVAGEAPCAPACARRATAAARRLRERAPSLGR